MADTTDYSELNSTDEWAAWRARMAASRRRRDDLTGLWQDNVRKRRGADTETTLPNSAARVPVNKDWPLTKAKLALLYSTTPQARLTSQNPEVSSKLGVFATRLNKQMLASSVGTAIEEELCDVINAAGHGAVVLSCEKRTELRDMPVIQADMLPPDMALAVQTGQMQIPTMPVQAITDIAYPIRRKSPASLLIPADFTGSNYDQARWLGYEDSLTWEQAVVNLGLTPDQKDRVLGPDRRAGGTTTTLNNDTNKFRDTQVVNYQEIYYWRFYYHAEETSFFALQRLVFVDGLDEPVVNEPYQGQKRMPDGSIVGVRRNPIQVLTLTYISDDCLPPSDSTISRAQVTELEESRAAMQLQRKHSIPIRWYDVNRISPGVRTLIESGTYQGLVPVSGPGDRAIGEVSRAAFPPERFEFDRVINGDIADYWQLGTNQQGGFASGERSAREAGIVERNFQTRIGHERSKVERHYVAITEVMAGLMSLHGGAELLPEALADVTFTIRVDSTLLVDAEGRIDQLMKFLNMTAQSGLVNAKPVIEEIASLSGLDPSQVVIDAKPPKPEPIAISVGGPEDISNPLFLATMMHTQQGPTPEDLQAAIKLLQAAQAAGVPVLPPVDPNKIPQPGALQLPPGPQRPQGLLPMEGGPGGPPPPGAPQGAPPGGLAYPQWEAAPRIDRRSEDGGA